MGQGLKRVAHRITRNEASTRPQYMIFVDTETGIRHVDPWTSKYPFRLAVAHYWRRRRDGGNDVHNWKEFTDPSAFWYWVDNLTQQKTVTYLISHNLLFDLAALEFLDKLNLWGWKCIFIGDRNHTRIYRFRKDDKTLICLDNCNFFRGRLADWGDVVGFPKVEVDFKTASDPELLLRCRQDVRIMVELWDWWLRFLDEHNCGMFQPTLAGQSMAAYRHSFMDFPIYVHNNEQALALERESYRGGRVEVFRVGTFTDGPYYKLDVNSMYPFVMKKYEYPNNLRDVGEGMTLRWLEFALRRFGIIAECALDTDEPWFPVRRNGRNVYPIGRFVTTLTTEEIRLALERGWLMNVGRWARYTMRPLFDEFVDYFYPLKVQAERDGNHVLRKLIKDMMNLLHGKFGQRGSVNDVIGECDPNDNKVIHAIRGDTHERFTIRHMGGTITREMRNGESFNSVPSIAAHVAANARLYLYELVQMAGREHVFYCDTDSLILDLRGCHNLGGGLFGSHLGSLKVEGVANEVAIRAPKDYTFGDTLKVKGVGARAEWLSENEAVVEHWPGLNTYLKSGPEPTYQTRRVLKHLNREILGGHVRENGWIEPFRYPEDKE